MATTLRDLTAVIVSARLAIAVAAYAGDELVALAGILETALVDDRDRRQPGPEDSGEGPGIVCVDFAVAVVHGDVDDAARR